MASMHKIINLNEACLKDYFSLSRIDQLINVTSRHEMLSFMDAFFKHNQILMVLEDEKNILFIMDQGLYCYKVLPLDLKNRSHLPVLYQQDLQGPNWL